MDINIDDALDVCTQALKDKNWSPEQVAAIEYVMMQLEGLNLQLPTTKKPVDKGL